MGAALYEGLRRALAKRRVAAGLTQAELGARLRRSGQYVARYESGRRRLYVDEFVQIAKQLGMDPGQLLRLVQGSQSNGHVPRVRAPRDS